MNDQTNNNSTSNAPVTATAPGALSDRVRSPRLPDKPAGGGRSSAKLPWMLTAVLSLLLLGTLAVMGLQVHTAWLAADEAKKTQESAEGGKSSSSGASTVAAIGEVAHESKGYIIPAHQIQVSPKVSGMIVKLNVEEGKLVRGPERDPNGKITYEGDVLAVIEDTEYKADYDRAFNATEMARQQLAELTRSHQKEIDQCRAEFEEAEAQRKQLYMDFQRSANLRTGSGIAAREYEQSESQYRAMDQRARRLRLALELIEKGPRIDKIKAKEAEIRQMDAEVVKTKWRLDNCTVRAPISGTILTKFAEEGNIVNQLSFNLKGSLCDMADLSDLEVDLTIQERDISRVFKGQKCRVRSEAYPDKVYDGVVSRLMPIADRGKGAVPVRVKLTVPKEEEGVYLKPEMGAVVLFLKAEKK